MQDPAYITKVGGQLFENLKVCMCTAVVWVNFDNLQQAERMPPA